MRRYKTAKLAILILIAIFTINTTVLYALFDINIFKPVNHTESTETAGQDGSLNSNARPGYSPHWNTREYDNAYSNDSEDTNLQGIDEFQNTGEPQNTQNDNSKDEIQNSDECFLTEAQVADLEKIDIRDKLSAISMITKLSGEESDIIIDMAQDGVTYEELKKIEAILQKYLASEEIENLKAILEKSIYKN